MWAPAEAGMRASGRANGAANGDDADAGGRRNDGQISNHPIGNATEAFPAAGVIYLWKRCPAAALSTLPNSSVIKSESSAGVRCTAAEQARDAGCGGRFQAGINPLSGRRQKVWSGYPSEVSGTAIWLLCRLPRRRPVIERRKPPPTGGRRVSILEIILPGRAVRRAGGCGY